ncbi:MAG: adenylate/guanylate cyclase domain-containing protein [Clostridiales bacterium]|nr:adenylate/guanylate cyclase domain-containing protein [Clostridiales bacterium]
MADLRKKLISSLVVSLSITALMASGLMQRPGKWLDDRVFQTPRAVPGDIVIIGIDEKAISEFGPYNTWDRSIMASAINELSKDPEYAPAVIAIDTLYSGESGSEGDKALAEAAENAGNVITASAADFGTSAVFGGDRITLDDYSVQGYEEPYQALADVTARGHINAMYDMDGVMRHALLYVKPDEETVVYSMAFTAAQMYSESKGIPVEMPAVNERGQFYVPYSSGPGGFYDGVSLADIVNGEIPPEYYAGKIVLIGPYTAGLQDSYFTPVDRSIQMYGVEIQANVIRSILDGSFKTEAPDLLQLLYVFIICFMIFYLCMDRKILLSGILCAAFAGAGLLAAVTLYELGFVTHVLWIPAGVLLEFMVLIILRYMRTLSERQKVTRTFERYVAPGIVNEILKEGTDSLELGGKLCDIAVLFVDIRGFTSMSERMAPEKVVLILNRYLAMTSEAVEKNGGTLDKFVGDAAMAFWGAPLPQEDPVFKAVQTAVDIIKGAGELSRKLKEEIDEELNVGVGVHFGPAVVGNMGSERHMDYTAIGDTVNTAARLESNAPAGNIYVSRAVADELKGRMEFVSLHDSVRLKGKAEGFEVLKLKIPEDK